MSYTTGQTKLIIIRSDYIPKSGKRKRKRTNQERERESAVIVQAGPQREGTEEKKKIKSRGQDGRVRMTR
jgi:hypothetical protein